MTKRRASKRLAATNKKAKAVDEEKEEVLSEEEAEKEVESAEEEEPFPLEELNLDMLNCALEKLTVKETMTMRATSKAMLSFYESKAKFKIPFEFPKMEVYSHTNGKALIVQRNPPYPYCNFGRKILKTRDPLLSELQKLPFRFQLHELTMCGKVVPAMEDVVKERLELLKIESIEVIYLGSKTSAEEMEILERSLGDMKITHGPDFTGAEPSSLGFPFINRHSLSIFEAKGSLYEHMVTIQNKQLAFLMLHEDSMNEIDVAVEVVLQKWSSPSHLEVWALDFTSGSQQKTPATYEAFAVALEVREPIDFHTREPPPPQRPLFFRRNGENGGPNHYYIARADGSLVHIFFHEVVHALALRVDPLIEGPPILSIFPLAMTKRQASKRLAAINKKAKAVGEEKKQKEEVSIEKEEEVKEDKSKVRFPLKQLDLDMLNCALEKLTVKETMRMMATSKSMMSFYETKAKFKIPFEYHSLQVFPRTNGKTALMQQNAPYPFRHFGSRILKTRDPFLTELQKLPFRFHLGSLSVLQGMTPALGDALKQRLELLKIEFIKNVNLGSKISAEEMEILERSLGNVKIQQGLIFSGADPSSLVFPFVLRHTLRILAKGSLCEHVMTIQNRKLLFRMSEDSNNEIKAAVEIVIQKWSSPSLLEMWELGFISGSRKKMSTIYEAFAVALEVREPIDFYTSECLPPQRPLFFRRKGANDGKGQYFIVRSDGSLVHIYCNESCHTWALKVVPLIEGPPILSM